MGTSSEGTARPGPLKGDICHPHSGQARGGPDRRKAYMMVAEVEIVLGTSLSMHEGGRAPSLRATALFVLCALALAACSAAGGSESAAPIAEEAPDYQGLRAGELGPHRSSFRLEFSGEEGWLYQLDTRLGGEVVEQTLRVEGVSDARSPGDVRVVTRGDERRMKGPATNEACLRFPRNMDLNVTLLSPDDVIPVGELNEPLVSMGQDTVAGRPAIHYAVMQSELGNWQEALLGIWLDRGTQAVLRYDLTARGRDPYFAGGFGEISGSYQVVEVGPQTIEPLSGCEIELPLPEGTRQLVRLPDEISYHVEMTMDEIVAFYRRTMAEAGWRAFAEEERGSGAIALRYRREGERVDITVRDMGDERRVDINIR